MNNRLLLIIIGGLVVLALVVVGVAVACSPRKANKEQSQDVTLTYWGVFTDSDKMQPLIDEYQKQHPKIKIEYRKLTYEEYEKTLVDAIASGRGPDIFSIQNTWMPRYFNKISPVPEDELTVEDYRKDFYPAVSDTIKDNRIYGLPVAMDVLMLYVNNGTLSRADVGEPPKTWEALAGVPGNPQKPGIISKVNNRQGNTFNFSTIALGNNRIPRSMDVLSLMMLQQKTKMVNEDKTQATFNLPQPVEGKEAFLGTDALKYFNSFANAGTANYTWNAQQGDAVTAFAQARVAMFIGYSYHAPVLTRLNPELSFDIAPVPQIEGTEPINYASYWAESVSRNSQHAEDAWKFIRYLTDRSQMQQFTEATASIPARKSVAAGNKLGGNVQKQLETAQTWYQGDATKADEIFRTMIDQVLTGQDFQRTIDAGANRLTTVLKELLAQNQ